MNQYPPVVIEREFDASVERVFEAWTDPKQLMLWFTSSPNVNVIDANVDLRIGGSYRLTIGSDSEPWVVFGTYTDIEPPNLLEFTWLWEEATMEPSETIVRVELRPIETKTFLRITHSRLSNEPSFQAHGKGWTGVLSSLDRLLQKEHTP